MKMLRSVAVGLALSWLMSGWAFAGTSTITTKDASGTTKTFDVITDGSGNFGAMIGVCDGTALAQCAAVKAASTAAAQTDPALVMRNPDAGTIGDAAWTSGNGTHTSLLKAIDRDILASTISPGTAGTPSSQVLTIQGVGSMTKLLVTPDSVALPANQSTNVNQFGGTNVVNCGLAGCQSVGGGVATNVAITDNPINTGAQAVSSENSAVTTARKVQLVADLVGKLIVMPFSNPENILNPVPTAAVTDTTSTQTMAAIASFRNYVTYCKVTNSHATVGTFVQILDGATVVDSGWAAAAGGGFVTTYQPPIRGSTNTALNCQATTTGANFKCSCGGYKGV